MGSGFASVAALGTIRSGEAENYYQTAEERLEVLTDPDIRDAVLPPYPTTPFMLYTEDITDEYRNEFLWGLIYSAISDPYVNRLFNSITINDPTEQLDEDGEVVVDEETGEPVIIEGHIEYELVRPINESLFIMDVVGYGMIAQWLMPLVFSTVNLTQMYGTSAEKFYAQANHTAVNNEVLDKAIYLQRKIIRDRGLTNNSYIGGTSASSKLRSGES